MELIKRSEFQGSFDQIQVIASKSHIPIQQLYKQLQQVSQQLQGELIELINNDYKQFISLSYNLAGFDDSVTILRNPIDRLLEKSQLELDNLVQITSSVQTNLENRRILDDHIRVLKDCIQVDQCLSKVNGLLSEEVDIKKLERIGIEYNQLNYLLSKPTDQFYLLHGREQLLELKTRIITLLDDTLKISFLDHSYLFELFRIYVSMDVTANALTVFENVVLQPFIDKKLIQYKQQIQQLSGHGNLYDQLFIFFSESCQPLHAVGCKVKGFPSLLIHGWSFITQCLMKEFQLLFHVATPSTFFEAYQSSCKFLVSFEQLLHDDIGSFRKHSAYTEYSKKWQLSVYFQLM
jgi:conserved oligomeric Golgi complex subunit 2